MLVGLIAECGNHAFGDLGKAKEQVRLAREAGAKFAKFQAIDTEVFEGGSMPAEFYRQCDLGAKGYQELVDYGEEVGIPVIFSVFGPKYAKLARGRPYKIAGSQFESFSVDQLLEWNSHDHPVIVSLPNVSGDVILYKRPTITNMHCMYVTPYNPTSVEFQWIVHYEDVLRKPIGFSDHSPGIKNCLTAIDKYECRLIEKHFCPWGRQAFKGVVYRDSIHAADAVQLERLSKAMRY